MLFVLIKNMSKKIIYYSVRSIVYAVLGTGIFLLVYFLFNGGPNLKSACDGCFISGGCLAVCSLMTFLYLAGYLDFFFYGIMMLPAIFTENKRRYNDLNEYKDSKKIKRKFKNFDFLVPLIIATIFIVVAIALNIVIKQSI